MNTIAHLFCFFFAIMSPHTFVRFYDVKSKRFFYQHKKNIKSGFVQAEVDGKICWVNRSDLQLGDIKHSSFVGDRSLKVLQIQNELSEVYSMTYEDWELGFRRDTNPDSEISIWLNLCAFYNEFSLQLQSKEERQELFQILNCCLCSIPDFVLKQVKLNRLDTIFATEVVTTYFQGYRIYSSPTISNSFPLMITGNKPTKFDCALTKYNWLQIEFLPCETFAGVQSLLEELKVFEASNRESVGWKNIFVRKHEYATSLGKAFTLSNIAIALGGLEPNGLYIYNAQNAASVQDGFSFSIGCNTHIVGYSVNGRIAAMGAWFDGKNATFGELSIVMYKLSALLPIMIVDWLDQKIILGNNSGMSVEVWQPKGPSNAK